MILLREVHPNLSDLAKCRQIGLVNNSEQDFSKLRMGAQGHSA